MARFDLTDSEWAVIAPLLPTDVRGKERVDDRRVLNGISSGGCARVRPGPTSRRATVPTRLAATASGAGASVGSGTGFWRRCQRLTTATCR